MISVRLKNPEVILTPITEEEKTGLEKEFMGDENIYVLYKLPDSGNIHIGMMSSSVRKYCPSVANVHQLEKATAMAFFYNGSSTLESNASNVTDRPVYRIVPTEDRVISECQILNGSPDNGLEVFLDDIVEGNYTLTTKKPSILQKMR